MRTLRVVVLIAGAGAAACGSSAADGPDSGTAIDAHPGVDAPGGAAPAPDSAAASRWSTSAA